MLRLLLALAVVCLGVHSARAAQEGLAGAVWRLTHVDGNVLPPTETPHGLHLTEDRWMRVHNGCGVTPERRFGDTDQRSDVADLRVPPNAFASCEDVPDALTRAYRELTRRAVRIERIDAQTVTARRVAWAQSGGVEGSTGQRYTLSRVPGTHGRAAWTGAYELFTGTGLTPRAPDSLPLTRLHLTPTGLHGHDGCAPLAVETWPVDQGWVVVRRLLANGAPCDTPVARALHAVLAEPIEVSTVGDAVILSGPRGWVHLEPAGTHAPPHPLGLRVGESWDVVSAPGAFVQIVARDAAIMHRAACEGERVHLIATNDHLAGLRQHRDAGGANRWLGYGCDSDDAPLRLDTVLRVTRNGDELLVDGAPWLRRDSSLDGAPILSGTWALVSATDHDVATARRPARLSIGPGFASGSDGCNSGGGPIRIQDGKLISLGWMQTMAGCADGQEQAFHRLFGADSLRYPDADTVVATRDGQSSTYRRVTP